MILGVDPGLGGGLAIIGNEGIMTETMPVTAGEIDLARLARWLKAHSHDISMAFVEKVHSMPKQGVSSTFKFGDVYGTIKGMLTAFGIPFELVTPQSWTKELHAGVSKGLPAKERSRLVASRLFPDLDLRESSRCRVPHDGMIDALLIAEYGIRKMGKGIQ